MGGIVAIGDNVVDKYIDLGIMFPGGNCINVAVLSKRYGVDTAYLGCLGHDREGKHILKALTNEGVDISRTRVLEGANAYVNVKLIDGDRKFLGNDRGVSRNIKLTKEDIDFIKAYDVIYTNIYSGIEKKLPLLKSTNRPIAFDFSNHYTKEYMEEVLPYIDYAFFSGSEMTDQEIRDFLMKVHTYGPDIVLVTKGSRGACLLYEGKFYEQGIVPVKVLDTLGAGDSFISRLLVGILKDEEMGETLQAAAEEAAKTCTHHGAFGYGISI